MSALRIFPAAFFSVLLLLPYPLHAAGPENRQCPSQIARILGRLPQAKRRILDDTLRRADLQNRKLYEEKRALEAELESLMSARVFDKRTYLDKSAKLGTLRAKISANLEDVVAAVAAQFTPEERKILFKADTLWRVHGDYGAWSSNDTEDSHQPTSE